MAKDPAFLFYTSDFLVGTFVMSFEDKGKYITLLSFIHQHGRINEATVNYLVGPVSDNLKSKFKLDEDGLWYNERLQVEINKRRRFVNRCQANGKLGGRPRKKKKTKEERSIAWTAPTEQEAAVETEKYPFSVFWKLYDKPTEKQSCEVKWNKLAESDKELIFQKVPAYVAATPDRQFRKNPLTYIHRKIWLDELIPETRKKSAIEQFIETGKYE